jgi:hypothetical protein
MGRDLGRPSFSPQTGEHLRLRGFQNAIQASKHREGQNDLAIVRLLVVASQQISHGPDEGRQILVVHA